MPNSRMKWVSVLLALIMMLTAFGTTVAEQEKRKMESPEDADEWIAVFLGEQPEKLEGRWAMSAQMETDGKPRHSCGDQSGLRGRGI